MEFEKILKEQISKAVEKKAIEIGNELTAEYVERLRREIAKISIEFATTVYKFVSVDRGSHGISVLIKNDLLKDL
jgi:hypothetical protein